MNPAKKEIREQIRILKNACPDALRERKSEQIMKFVEQTNWFETSNVILAYWSLPDEVQTHKAIVSWAARRTVLLPVVRKEGLQLIPFSGLENMRPSPPFGIMEPVGSVYENWEAIDMVVVPGVAFDRDNHRLGRGKGYYDRLLSMLKAPKIGVGFDFQLLETVPAEAHDISMDLVIIN